MKPLHLLLLALAGCAAVPVDDRPPDPIYQGGLSPESERCVASPAVREYLAAAKTRILEEWQLPADQPADQDLSIVFSLRDDGSLHTAVVPDAATQSIEDSALAAIQAAAPFPPLDESTQCLSGLIIDATFRNPLAY